jgi:hopanoid biosynthesis associated RND transporter like protein HpnN
MRGAAAPRSAEARLDAALDAWVGFVERRARLVVWTVLVVTLGSLGWAATHLGVNSDNIRMLGEDLPVRQRHDEFARVFPNLTNALLVVIDGPTPEATRRTAEALASRLAAQPDRFRDVFRPGSGTFFERNGLLFRSPEELEALGDQIAEFQPFLIALEREPTIATLTSLVQRGLERFDPAETDPATWTAVLDRISQATVAVYEEYPVAISWDDLLLRGSALETRRREVIIVEPVLDFDSVLPAAEPLAAIRAAAAALPEAMAPEIRVRITGNPALNHEEMLALAWDIGVLGLVSFAIVAGILWIALRSWRLLLAALATLLAGLVWTTALASITVGHLNLVSLTFAVLYIGLGIDFAIHLLMHYADQRRSGVAHRSALRGATRLTGSSLALCALTTTIGFYAFLPTDYLGVAELGLIAGSGMLVILFHTLTFLPALLSSWLEPPPGVAIPTEPRLPAEWSRELERHPTAVRWSAALAAVTALFALPALRFDPNVIDLRNPDTESVQAFRDLVADGGSATPWYADVLASDLASARTLAAKLRAVPGIERTVTLADYVPADQDVKRDLLADIAFLLDPVGDAPEVALEPATDPAEQVAALRALHDALGVEWLAADPTPLGATARRLRKELSGFLERSARDEDPGPELAQLERTLLGALPRQIDRLRGALDPERVTQEDLPDEVRARMLARDGRARVQVFPTEDLRDRGALDRFADAVQSVAPDATGMAIDVVGFGRVISRSLVEALAAASVLIALLVLVLWRRPGDVVLVLAPLLLAGLLIAATMVTLGVAFNFVNVIVLPLLLGIGVDSGIHLVHRARAHAEPGLAGRPLLASTTGRAVFYSFATTMVSFGTLAFSNHRGVASLGLLLAIGMSITMLCNLIVLPALIEWRLRPTIRPGGAEGR